MVSKVEKCNLFDVPETWLISVPWAFLIGRCSFCMQVSLLRGKLREHLITSIRLSRQQKGELVINEGSSMTLSGLFFLFLHPIIIADVILENYITYYILVGNNNISMSFDISTSTYVIVEQSFMIRIYSRNPMWVSTRKKITKKVSLKQLIGAMGSGSIDLLFSSHLI